VFLRGLFEKIQAEPQIAKRADYKSAADMYMEKNMTPADREQVTELMQSWYDTATAGAAAARKLSPKALRGVRRKPAIHRRRQEGRLIDKVGYDDDAMQAALDQAEAAPNPCRWPNTSTPRKRCASSAGAITSL